MLSVCNIWQSTVFSVPPIYYYLKQKEGAELLQSIKMTKRKLKENNEIFVLIQFTLVHGLYFLGKDKFHSPK